MTITQRKFEQLKDGMSYQQVVKLLGSEGKLESSVSLGGIKTLMYGWQNEDGSNVTIQFQNDRLVVKAQFGLP